MSNYNNKFIDLNGGQVLVNKIKSIINTKVGDLSELSTTNKDDLVSAINEVLLSTVDIASLENIDLVKEDLENILTKIGKKKNTEVPETDADYAVESSGLYALLEECILNLDSTISTSSVAIEETDSAETKANKLKNSLNIEITQTDGKLTAVSGEIDTSKIATVDFVNNAIGTGVDLQPIAELISSGGAVEKNTTIAGINLQDNITKEELQTALDIPKTFNVNDEAVSLDDDGNINLSIKRKDGVENDGKLYVNEQEINLFSGEDFGSNAYTDYSINISETAVVIDNGTNTLTLSPASEQDILDLFD